MIYDLKPYPAYKDSGVPWLGEIPEHWYVGRLKQVCTRSALYGANIAASSYSPIGIRFLRTTDIREDGTLKSAGVYVKSEDAFGYLLEDGDILISRSGTVGRSFLYNSTTHGLCAYAGYLVRFVLGNALLPKFLFYFTKTPSFADFLKLSSIQSTIENVNGDKYANSLVPIPLLSEQSTIVRYLDHFDRRIRHYIRAKKKLIKLLEEQKQAIIHQAVTRGLDPNVKLKPSGVEWLGDVPEHWEVRQLGRFITLQRGFDITKEHQVEGNVQVVSSGGVFSYHNQSTSLGPGVIIGRKGSVGTVHFVEGAYWAHDTTLWVKEFNDNYPKFIYYVLLNLDLKRFDTGSANPTINRNIIHPEIVAFPPTCEQFSISSYLDHKLEQNKKLIEHYLQEISLLREYRTHLIADIVTGKMDVREAAANLPEETDETEVLEDEFAGDEETAEEELESEPEEE